MPKWAVIFVKNNAVKKRIRYIMVLMTVSILGANFFQGYWLFQAYQLNHREMTRLVNISLSNAVTRSEIGRVQVIMGGFDSLSTAIPQVFPEGKKGKIKMIRVEADSVDPAAIAEVRMVNTGDSVRMLADTLAKRISNMMIVNKMYEQNVHLADLDSIFQEELLQRQVEAGYVLDTMRVPDWQAYRNEQRPPIRLGQAVVSRIVPLNYLSRLGVQVTIPNPASLIVSRMTGILVGSVILLFITIWAFVYMLRTILKQKQLSEVKSDFINNMTHELKTPIATVSAAVEALQYFDAIKDPEKASAYLEISRQELNRLSGLVEKVLNIALEERRDFKLQPIPVDVTQLLESVVQHYKIRNGKQINISLSCQLSQPLVMLDETHFTNAIHNLVDNAVKYSHETVHIGLRCEQEGDMMKIVVTDDGIGIPKAYHLSIFEQFFRVPQGDLHNVKGFGLGLAYVRKIVEMHGGRISVRSEPGQGATFTILVPHPAG
jgi:two-component system, OmpR family, phosphate regulon sensor histidine kinase PhoR